jgi:hypothetical protein
MLPVTKVAVPIMQGLAAVHCVTAQALSLEMAIRTRTTTTVVTTPAPKYNHLFLGLPVSTIF